VGAQPPAELGSHDGLAYALYLPDGEPRGGVVILHGAGSCKERHLGFARLARSYGFAAIAFDQRGHGASEGALGDGAIDDLERIVSLLPDSVADGGALPLALRGSSMGGYFALVGASQLGASAVVAICPASAQGLLRGLQSGTLGFDADADALERFLAAHDATEAVAELRAALLLMHAEADDSVPVEHSRALLDAAGASVKRLVAVPGGHHWSVQHDAELQGVSLQFIERALEGA
jgi:alpha-beta hydrolase superfamily lysophospholipase